MLDFTTQATQVQYLLNQQKSFMFDQLHKWCAINSGTDNLEGNAMMHAHLRDAFLGFADEIQSIPPAEVRRIDMMGNRVFEIYGESLFIRKRPELKRRVLLVGHMDTVYAKNDPFQTLTYLNESRLQGPGVADMKGGLVVLLHALNAFEETSFASEIGWDVFINPDEEVGSPSSLPFLEKIVKNYQTALVYEPAMTTNGDLAKDRRGMGKATLVATGRAAHSGRAFDEGRNAIAYLAEVLLAIHALNGKREGVTLNIGKILGGTAINMVPERAVVKLDMRFGKPDDEEWLKEELNQIMHQVERKDYALTLENHFDRPVKKVNEATIRLFERIQATGLLLGQDIQWQNSGGCCDGNNLAKHGAAILGTIDTLGVRGGNIHSPEEFILLDSLVERACLSSWLLMDIARNNL